jgi:hypothetical protein
MNDEQPFAKPRRPNLPSLLGRGLRTRLSAGSKVLELGAISGRTLPRTVGEPVPDRIPFQKIPARAERPNPDSLQKMNATKKDLMQNITRKVGAEQAIGLVMSAYNTELITNKLARMENKPSSDKLGAKKDHLELALRRVLDVVELTNP